MPNSKKSSVNEDSVTLVEEYFQRVNPSTSIGGKGETLFHTIFAQEYVTNEDFYKMIEIYGRGRSYAYIIERDANGNTPIHVAAKSGNANVIYNSFKYFYTDFTWIMQALPAIHSANNEGRTPLHLAAENQHLECVKALVEFIDVYANVKDTQGKTPLHTAILSKKDPSKKNIYYNIVKKLLKIPYINTDIENQNGESVYDDITKCKDEKLIALFIEHYSKEKVAAEFQHKNCNEKAESRGNLSKKCNKAAVGSTIIADITNYLHEYKQVHFAKAASIIKFLAVVPHASFFLSIALISYNISLSCKKKRDLLEKNIEKYKTKISELRNISKDIEHNEALTKSEIEHNTALVKLEDGMQESKKELLKIQNQIKDDLSVMKSRLEELSEIGSRARDLSNIVNQLTSSLSDTNSQFTGSLLDTESLGESCNIKQMMFTMALTNTERDHVNEQRRASCVARITYPKKTDRENSVVKSLTILEIPYSENSEGPSSILRVPVTRTTSVITSSNVEKEGDFRPRTSSCGAKFRCGTQTRQNIEKNYLSKTEAQQKKKPITHSTSDQIPSTNVEGKGDFRSRAASCGSRFKVEKKKNEEPSTILQSSKSLNVKGADYSRLQ